MRLKRLGYRAQELEAGAFRFLLSDSVPVAYQDATGSYRCHEFYSKATSRHQNEWLKGVRSKKVPQQHIQALFEGIDRVPERRHGDRRRGWLEGVDYGMRLGTRAGYDSGWP